MPRDKLNIAVIGCGTVGASWIALFYAAGHDVSVFDPAIGKVEELRVRIAPHLPALRSLGFYGYGQLDLASTFELACDGVDLVQESVMENLEAKVTLFRHLDLAAPSNSIIASSTSSLLLSDITVECRNPERCILAHPFNPPHLIPLVELFGTDNGIIAKAVAIYSALGKIPVVLKREIQGHIAGRLSSALFQEAVYLVAEGVASAKDIDTALRSGPALRWSLTGAFLAYHLGGGKGGIQSYLEHLGPSQERRWQDLGHPSLSKKTRTLIAAEVEVAYGDKTIDELEALRDKALVDTLNNYSSGKT